jgi:hypothetical protein
MPSLAGVIAKFTNQQMLYWPKTGSDSFAKPLYDPNAQQIAVRWEDRLQEIWTPDKRLVKASAYILLAVPLIPGSWVFLGGGRKPLTDWQALAGYPNRPTQLQGGREIIICNNTPDLRNTSNVFEAYV